MEAATEKTDALLQLAGRYLPGGTIHTFSYRPPGFPVFMDIPDFVIERGEGPWVWTTDGERLLDVVLGAGTALLGHAHPAIVAAVSGQIARGAALSHITPQVIELAAEVVRAVPSAEKARFYNSGTEAMMYAIRMVRAHTGRDVLIKCDGAYHGGGDGLLFRTNYGAPTNLEGAVADTPGIPASEAERVRLVPYNDLDALRAAVGVHRSELAAIVIEPVMRGIRADAGYLAGVCDIARSAGVPLIFDEVITGFRLALGGAQEFYGVRADLTVLGKALGAGLPIGAIVGSEELMSWLDPSQPNGRRILAEGSFYGNPLSAAAALANLRELSRPGTYQHLHELGDMLTARLDETFRRHGLKPQFVGVGPLVEFYFGEAPPRDYPSAQATDQRVKRALAAGLRARGVFGGGGRYNVSTAHGQNEIDLAAAAVEEIVARFRASDSR
jgi:glutamate-1-semialdehyde 2,1-aminomutase